MSPIEIKLAETARGFFNGIVFGADPLGALYSKFTKYETLGVRGLRNRILWVNDINKDVNANLDSRTYEVAMFVGTYCTLVGQYFSYGGLQVFSAISDYVLYRVEKSRLNK